MSVLIRGMEMPTRCGRCDMCVPEADGDIDWHNVCCITGADIVDVGEKMVDCPLVPVPPHGRLIDADALRAKMYHEAFETDTPMQKWDSGCWIRYKMFERMEEDAPTIILAEEE